MSQFQILGISLNRKNQSPLPTFRLENFLSVLVAKNIFFCIKTFTIDHFEPKKNILCKKMDIVTANQSPLPQKKTDPCLKRSENTFRRFQDFFCSEHFFGSVPK